MMIMHTRRRNSWTVECRLGPTARTLHSQPQRYSSGLRNRTSSMWWRASRTQVRSQHSPRPGRETTKGRTKRSSDRVLLQTNLFSAQSLINSTTELPCLNFLGWLSVIMPTTGTVRRIFSNYNYITNGWQFFFKQCISLNRRRNNASWPAEKRTTQPIRTSCTC